MKTNTKIYLSVFLITAGVFARLLPHSWNFSPIIAIGLFAGAYLGRNYAITIPFLSMFLSDIFIGFYDWKINVVVYLSMMLSGVIGLGLKKHRNIATIVFASITSSTLFFLITNSAVWYFGTMYNKSTYGLIESLSAGIPFFKNALLGDMWYSFIIFGAYELSKLFVPQLSGRFSKQTLPIDKK